MDKAPDLGLPFFYRVVLPGSFLTLAALPLIAPILASFGVMGKDQTPYLIGIGLGLGFVVSLLDAPIYEVLEGRRGWPRWLARWRAKRWKDFVAKLYARQDSLPEDDPAYDECWFLLRQFPVGADGNPTATMPSRIGNVIAAYEQYPSVRYGMDSVFYWPRLWLALDKEVRDEIDSPWAGVDAILYSGFGAGVIGAIYSLVAVATTTAWWLGFPGMSIAVAGWWVFGSFVLIGAFLGCTRIAIPGLVSNGENFKSVFDLYRSRLTLQPASDNEMKGWTQLASELQYGVEKSDRGWRAVVSMIKSILGRLRMS